MKIGTAIGLIFTLYASSAMASVTASLNGSSINNNGKSSEVVTGSFAFNNVDRLWQQHVTSDFLYQNNSATDHYDFDTSAKIDRNLDSRNYLQAGLRLEYDNLRKNTISLTSEIGHGYRLFHTKNLSLSNELGIGIHSDKSETAAPVVSDSIWFTWKATPRVTVANKFLTEQAIGNNKFGYDTYTNNIFTVSYALNSHVAVHIENRFRHEKFNNNKTTLVGLAVNF